MTKETKTEHEGENPEPTDPERCSSCDRSETEVGKLIAGHGAFICDACVQLCLAALNRLRPRPPANAQIPECGFCGRSAREVAAMHAGSSAQICGDCLETSVETLAWSDPAYREHLIQLLTDLAGKPWPQVFPTLV